MGHESNGTIKKIDMHDGVIWIALNDEPSETNVRIIAEQISVILLADLFGKTPLTIARRVVRARHFIERNTHD